MRELRSGWRKQQPNRLLSKAMAQCLSVADERRPIMVAAGQRTLELYGEFLLECSVAAYNLSSWQDRRFSGHGFQQCPAVGEYLAERIVGIIPTLNMSAFSADRFARHLAG